MQQCRIQAIEARSPPILFVRDRQGLTCTAVACRPPARHAVAARLLSRFGRPRSAAAGSEAIQSSNRTARGLPSSQPLCRTQVGTMSSKVRRTATHLGKRGGIGRELGGVGHANFALPSGPDVANVTTADPGVQVENVSARGRRTRYQRVPGSPEVGARWQKAPSYRAPTSGLSPGGTTPRTPRCPR